jgi:hypothetical protein
MRTELAERHETGECRPAADGAAIPLLVPAHVIGVRKADAVAISDGRRYYTLNDFSGRVWELIRDRAASMEEIVDGLAGGTTTSAGSDSSWMQPPPCDR